MNTLEQHEKADGLMIYLEERLNHPKFSSLSPKQQELLKTQHAKASALTQKMASAQMPGKDDTYAIDSKGRSTGVNLDLPKDIEFLTSEVRTGGENEEGWLEPPRRPGESPEAYELRVESKWTDDYKKAKAEGRGLVRSEKAETGQIDKFHHGAQKLLRSGLAGTADALSGGLLPKGVGALRDAWRGDPRGTYMEEHEDEKLLSPTGSLIGSVAGYGGIGALMDKGGRALAGKALAGRASPGMTKFTGQAAGGAIGGAGLGLVEAGGDAAQQAWEGQDPEFSGDKALMYGGLGGLFGAGAFGLGRIGNRMNNNYRSGSAHARDVRVQEKAEGRPSTSLLLGHTKGPKSKAAEDEARALGEKEEVVMGARELTALKGAKPLREDLQSKIDEQARSLAEEKEAFFKGTEPKARAVPFEDAPGRGLETPGGKDIAPAKKTQPSPGNQEATRPFGPGEGPIGRKRAQATTEQMDLNEKRRMIEEASPAAPMIEPRPPVKHQTLPSPREHMYGRGSETRPGADDPSPNSVPPGFFEEFPEHYSPQQRLQAYSNRLRGKPDDAPNSHPYPESIPPHDMGGSAGPNEGNVFLPVGEEVKRMLREEAELLAGTGSNNVLESMERKISDIQDARGLDNTIKNIQSKVNYESKGDSPVDSALKRVAYKAKELRKQWPGYFEMMERHEKATEEMNVLLQRLGITPGKNNLDENDLRALMGKMGPIGSGEDLLSQQAISGGKFRPEVMQGAERTANLEATQRLTGRTDPDIGMNATPGMMPRLFAHSRNIVAGPHPRIDAAARHISKLEGKAGLPAALNSSLLQAMQWDGMPLAETNPGNKLQYTVTTKKKEKK